MLDKIRDELDSLAEDNRPYWHDVTIRGLETYDEETIARSFTHCVCDKYTVYVCRAGGIEEIVNGCYWE